MENLNRNTLQNSDTMDNSDVISVLNDLIITSKDGQKGFERAAEGVKDLQLKNTLTEYARNCESGAKELQERVRMLNGSPETDGSTMGSLHRGWIELKEAITGKNDQDILNECERGEDTAKANYAQALKKPLPNDVRMLIQQQYEGVKRIHDHVKTLRNQHNAPAHY